MIAITTALVVLASWVGGRFKTAWGR